MPKVPNTELVKEMDAEAKIQQKRDFDRHRGSRELSDLSPGDTQTVRLRLRWEMTWHLGLTLS